MAARAPKKKRAKGVAPAAVTASLGEAKQALLGIEALLQEAAGLVAAEAGQVDQVGQAFAEAAVRLRAEVQEKDELLQARSAAAEERAAALKEMQESSMAQIQGREEQIRQRDEILKLREAEIADLRARLDSLSPEGSVVLREENIVNLVELEQGLEPESAPRLREERQTKAVAPAQGARAAGKRIGQSVGDVVVRPGRAGEQDAATRKKSSLLTLLGPTKRRS